MFQRNCEKQQFVKDFCYSIAKMTNCKSCSINIMNNDDSIFFVKYITKDNKNLFLNLFVVEEKTEFLVYYLNLVCTRYSFFELSKEEYDRLNNYQTFEYGNYVLSLKQIFFVEECSKLVTFDGSFEKVVIDSSTVSKRKNISDIIQKYLFQKYYSQSENVEINIKNEIIDKLALLCMYAKKMNSFKANVAYEDDISLKVMIEISNGQKVEKLPIVLNKRHVVLYYCHYDGNCWVESLLPESIADIANLFKE